MTGNPDLLNAIIRQKESDLTRATEINKPNVVAVYDLMLNQGQPRAAIEKYTGDECIKHNPHVADGKEGFMSISNAWHATSRARLRTSNAQFLREV